MVANISIWYYEIVSYLLLYICTCAKWIDLIDLLDQNNWQIIIGCNKKIKKIDIKNKNNFNQRGN